MMKFRIVSFPLLGPQAVQGDGRELRQGAVRVHHGRYEERDRPEGGRRRRQGVRQGGIFRGDHALRRAESVLEDALLSRVERKKQAGSCQI